MHVVFYAKPGCKGNARQVRVLLSAGHDVEVRDLLSERWTEAMLLGFFDGQPAAEWFNRSAVRIKSGEIIPEALSEDQAMALLLFEPALIRRPLIEADGRRYAGWEPEQLDGWIGLGSSMSPGKESCLLRAGRSNTAIAPVCRPAPSEDGEPFPEPPVA